MQTALFPQAIIFDMDGVLIDSEPIWSEAMHRVFNKYGITIGLAETNETVGLRIDEVVDLRKSQFKNVSAPSKQIADETVDEVIRLIELAGKPIAGIPELLETIKTLGIPMALATSSSERIIRAVLDTLGFRPYFKAVHSAEHEKHGKPFPDVFLTAAKKINAKPELCLVFEDSVNGVKAALNANMKAIVLNSNVLPKTAFNNVEDIWELPLNSRNFTPDKFREYCSALF